MFLVRHTYIAGWHLPGGGVERGETAHDAMVREFREEAEIRADGPLRLVGLYRNATAAPRDHVALFVAPAFTVLGPKARDREIAEAGFFSVDALPRARPAVPSPACGRFKRASRRITNGKPENGLASPAGMVFRERRRGRRPRTFRWRPRAQ